MSHIIPDTCDDDDDDDDDDDSGHDDGNDTLDEDEYQYKRFVSFRFVIPIVFYRFCIPSFGVVSCRLPIV